jgi:flagellar FliJ protein
MAKFNYSMQNILDIKYKLEDQAKTEYAQEKAALDAQKEILWNMHQRRVAYSDRLTESVSSILDLNEIRNLEDAVETMKYKIRIQAEATRKAEKKVDLAEKKLTFAMKERKTYEKLKENAFEVFKQEVQAQESKEIDELTSFQYGIKAIRQQNA